MEGIVPQVASVPRSGWKRACVDVRSAKTDSLPDHFESAQWSRAYGNSKGSWRGAIHGLRSRPTIPGTGGNRARGSPGREWGAKVG